MYQHRMHPHPTYQDAENGRAILRALCGEYEIFGENETPLLTSGKPLEYDVFDTTAREGIMRAKDSKLSITRHQIGCYQLRLTPTELLLIGGLLGSTTGNTGFHLYETIAKEERRNRPNGDHDKPRLRAAHEFVKQSNGGAVNTDDEVFHVAAKVLR
jgi:hypothetical protein